MRIGIDARLTHYQAGGISRYTISLTQALLALPTEDRFVILQSRKDRNVLATGERAVRRSLWTPPHHALEQFTLPAELLGVPLDVLHSPDFIPPFHQRSESVITVHDLAFLLYPGLVIRESARYYGQVGRAVAEAAGIIAVSDATRQDIVRLFGIAPERVDVVYHGVDSVFSPIEDDALIAAFREQQDLPERYALWVGTLEPRKNVETLLRAIDILRRGSPPHVVPLVLVGSRGWLYSDTLQLVEDLGLGSSVRFFGPANRGQLRLLYNSARLFVFPSLYEGFGLPPLEAQACGLPVIAADVPALAEVLGESGVLVPPREPEAWAEAMARWWADEEGLQGLRASGLAHARTFSWEEAAHRTYAVYQKAART